MQKIVMTGEELQTLLHTGNLPTRITDNLTEENQLPDNLQEELNDAGNLLKSLGIFPNDMVHEAIKQLEGELLENTKSDVDAEKDSFEEFINSLPDDECDCPQCSGTGERTLDDIIRDYDARNNVNQEETLPQEPKPDWASASAIPGTVEVKTVLNTRDGRRIGNAVVADVVYDVVTTEVNFLVATDAGNVLTLNPQEIQELFHEPKWITRRYPDQSAESGLANYYKGFAR